VSLSNGEHIKACTLVWTAGTTTHPLLESLSCTKEKGRVLVDDTLAVLNCPGAWALGDCAAIPDGYGGFHPPTAQHAIRQARTVARNIAAAIHGKQAKPFRFRTLGQLASLGHQRGVAQIFGFRFSGFAAWWLWRTIYLLKLPRFERRCRVAFDWTLDLMLGKDTVQLPVSSESFRAADAVPAMDTEGHASSSGRW
jgi:NADH dehydrogenase